MDLHAKKTLLLKIPNGLYVIGVRWKDHYHAFTGSWLTQISMKPPMIVVGVRSDAESLEFMKHEKIFSVNYIRKSHKTTIEHFFKPVSDESDRLGSYPFHTDKTGAPILNEAIGYLECKVRKVIGGFGDHEAVIGEVVNAKLIEEVDPIIMSDTPWHYGG